MTRGLAERGFARAIYRAWAMLAGRRERRGGESGRQVALVGPFSAGGNYGIVG